MRERRHYAEGTYLDMEFPFGIYIGGRALCADGKVRRIQRIATTADTFFSIPASVLVWEGKRPSMRRTVSGYVSVDDVRDGHDVVRFHAHVNGKYGHLLVDNPCIHCGCPTREFGTQAMDVRLNDGQHTWEEQETCPSSPTGKHQRKEIGA